MAWLQAPDRAPFAHMVGQLLPELEKRTNLDDIDLVLLAHWLPDLHLGTSVTNYALHRLGLNNGFGFAISDRGPSAPLFALNCAQRYLSGGCKRALLMVMDQKHLLYRSDLVDRLKPRNSACLMVVEQNEEPGAAVSWYESRTGVPSEAIASTISDICHKNGMDRSSVTVIANPDVADAAQCQGPVLRQDPRLLCSAPFAVLAGAPDFSGAAVLTSYADGELTAVCLEQGLAA